MTRRTTLALAVAPLAASLTLAVPAPAGDDVRASKATRRTAADPDGRLAFTKKRLRAPRGRITLVMRNPRGSGLPHGIGIRGRDGRNVGPGGRSRTTIRLRKRGRYTFYCTFPGHRAAGMKGRLIVR